ncbi:MAG: hypothetical protein DRI90_12125 [Deltaproteobacteria bacterium]|nr:MAG: hypothetical protein DRI90_12125 [Deltaproteobacteria bacterium]
MKAIAPILAAAFALMGCAPTPEKLCQRLEELGSKPPKCVLRLQVESSQDDAAFKKRAECINNAQSAEAGDKCMH